jgi:DNA-binding Lrp family transcriptional regulator
MPYGLDDVDRSILYYLSEDARHNSASAIADEVRVSAQTVRNRIEKLEENGVIEGYHAQIDFKRADGLLTNLFMCTTSAKDRERLARQALRIPGVINVREIMTGHTDLRITAVGSDTDEITQIARAITDLGIDIEEEDIVRREHVSPYSRYGPWSAGRGPEITDFLTIAGDAEIMELQVGENAAIDGKTLQVANAEGLLDENVLVVEIEREDTILTPRGGTRIEAGDRVTLLSRQGIDASLETAFAASTEE